MKKAGSASDPLWFKDAIIYELHVRAFFDSNGDGVGDLPGLTQKLDYLQDLGVTCLWLLPFFPSPLRDDGYDISDYTGVHPMYGTMDDFRTFLDGAHERGLQVMIELVMNHTSDQHPWFQSARQAPADSPERDFYIWSNSDQKFPDARIIFTDTEKSNWTWDPVAQAYYWHRFFSHQPDLNYDNPRVVEEMLKIMNFWLELGVDALRLDAIPYLVEREGTVCENLPETHALIKRLRHEIDEGFGGRMILAEANQWPADVRPYFGDGDECHMAFHFPLMPRIYMALRQEDRLAITDIMAQTPPIPDTCQWGLFLRNHDELTLEMVTSDERDYMYLAYSADSRMRVNLGIRRRLAPLVDNNRRRIELLNALLFSFPGTPILYYGDEVGMGDNIYLGDRNGVRTPMQWSADRNAGFSRANPAKLYSPVIMDPVWGYEAINVEAQQSDPSSLLNWMRNMIALRKLFQVFGRGSLEFLEPANRKVLAYLRRYGDEQVLCVANLSRFAQPVDLDLAELEGTTPVEMLGYVQFPPIERQPYRLTLGPYGFLWLELHPKPESAEEVSEATLPPLPADNWEAVLDGYGRSQLETVLLPEYLPKQRWFGGKARRIRAARIVDWCELPQSAAVLALVEASYLSGDPDTYLLPLAMTFGQDTDRLRQHHSNSILSSVISQQGRGLLHDAALDDSACTALLALIENAAYLSGRSGAVRGVPGTRLSALRGAPDTVLPPARSSAEQSNTSIIYGDRLILKLIRRQQQGPNPESELGKYLTETAGFDGVPPFAGTIEYEWRGGASSTLAVLQGLVANEGDAWTLTTEELERYYENCARVPLPEDLESNAAADLLTLSGQPPSQSALDYVGIALDSMARLGKRTAALHLALAAPSDDPAFSPEPLASGDLLGLLGDLREDAAGVFDVLRDSVARLPDEMLDLAGLALGRRRQILDNFRFTSGRDPQAQRTRIHGDYHLGQVLQVRTDYVIVDFEGEPARGLEERRAKHSPLKDVAGMLRSLSYAAYASLISYTARRPEDFEKLEPWARLWERSVSAEFLRAYRDTASGAGFLPSAETDLRELLYVYWLDKLLYELSYELNNRPEWVRIPLMGILSLPVQVGGREWTSTPFRNQR
ncbi:MAG TPA: maltose alpha-D-glucosyltransferase [Candidatus Acidoferrales bacterium]|nr:maltose alpha-D-glucosyltransferase [Candidatus Acidoferrales bacterium]